MWLVSGDKENLSSMPRGMKIISELLNTEWKQRLDDFGSPDMYNHAQCLLATVQCVVLSHFMLNEHSTSAVPHGVTGKIVHLANGRIVTNTVMHGSGNWWQRAIHLHPLCKHAFIVTTVTPPCPLVTQPERTQQHMDKASLVFWWHHWWLPVWTQ